MSSPQIERNLLPEITDGLIAKCVSNVLRNEHSDIYSALKHIERVTGINALTASNWYKGRYAPKASHLLRLAAHYPEVLHALLILMDFEQLWHQAVAIGVIKMMRSKLDNKLKRRSLRGDKFVPIQVCVPESVIVQLNERQLWFLGHLQQGNFMIASDIVRMWHVNIKTARRDIRRLLDEKLIAVTKTRRINRYSLI